jgi:hypothetical protein
VAAGQMPDIITHQNDVHLVYGRNDSILYTISTDQGKKFSKEKLVAVLPGLAASHTRGPQLAVTFAGTLITACNNAGDIFSYALDRKGNVVKQSRVNDVDTVAKENLMALSADGNNALAVWLDLRNGRNQIYGAASSDGGITWSKNIRVYASPDSTVCECCKPSVVVKKQDVYVMFRNWLNGNRDLYVAKSVDNGKSFNNAEKIGIGSWKMKACPMDGGGIALGDSSDVHTVFNRDGVIYSCAEGAMENRIGEGRSCTMDEYMGREVYAWVEQGQVVYMDDKGRKSMLGKGQLPRLKTMNNTQAICIWEDDKMIKKAVLSY